MQLALTIYTHAQGIAGLLAGAVYLLSLAWERRLTQDEDERIIYRS